jgi:RimJ/RimL family protein N-acetyltransferase
LIRRLTLTDADAFYAMRLRSMAEAYDFFRSSVADIEVDGIDDCKRRLASEHVRIVGAFNGDTLVGIGGITREDRDKLRHKALLWGMFVASEAVGQGLGAAIVDALIAEAQGFVRSLTLTLAADNDRARMLYERSGFTIYGREPQSVRQGEGRYIDELLMWRLSEGSHIDFHRHAELVSASISPSRPMVSGRDGPWNAVTEGETSSG